MQCTSLQLSICISLQPQTSNCTLYIVHYNRLLSLISRIRGVYNVQKICRGWCAWQDDWMEERQDRWQRKEGHGVSFKNLNLHGGYLSDVITCAEFPDKIYSGYDFTGDRISHFPVLFAWAFSAALLHCLWYSVYFICVYKIILNVITVKYFCTSPVKPYC